MGTNSSLCAFAHLWISSSLWESSGSTSSTDRIEPSTIMLSIRSHKPGKKLGRNMSRLPLMNALVSNE
jgi:hypothetical protein